MSDPEKPLIEQVPVKPNEGPDGPPPPPPPSPVRQPHG